MLWDFSETHDWKRALWKLSQRAGLGHSTVQGVICKAEPANLGLLNPWPFFYLLCLILFLKDTMSFQQ